MFDFVKRYSHSFLFKISHFFQKNQVDQFDPKLEVTFHTVLLSLRYYWAKKRSFLGAQEGGRGGGVPQVKLLNQDNTLHNYGGGSLFQLIKNSWAVLPYYNHQQAPLTQTHPHAFIWTRFHSSWILIKHGTQLTPLAKHHSLNQYNIFWLENWESVLGASF